MSRWCSPRCTSPWHKVHLCRISIRVRRWSWSKSRASGRLSRSRTRASRKYLPLHKRPHGWLHRYTAEPVVRATYTSAQTQRTLASLKGKFRFWSPNGESEQPELQKGDNEREIAIS